MPRDPSIQRVLIIGSGPIVIGQACEFDYSGTQACNALREEGIGIVLLNSNPATIMTDPEIADRTYLEPITPEVVDEILAAEAARGTPVDSILPTLGGQTGLNTAMQASADGILARHGVRLIGANRDTIRRAEDRAEFKRTMIAAGIDVPRSGTVSSLEEARPLLDEIGLPVVIRPAYTLGGSGGGMARTLEEFERIVADGISQSPIQQVLVEEDLTGWKEFELEMMRDRNDNVVVVCSIENLDPMGVHTGDSITVAPALTLSDKEYQRMRDAAITIMRAVGVETGGSNIQFALDPRTGRMVVIEMNPRVSRSSALASKATGFAIARIATKLAIGYTLDEIRNDITRETPACFEPAIDYCVVKIPRFAFEKFPDANETLTTSMKSVGEAMAIGRTFREAFQKCIRSMEIKRFGYGLHQDDRWLEAVRAGRDGGHAAEGLWIDAQNHGHGAAFTIGGTSLGEAPGDWEEHSSHSWPVPEDVLVKKIGTPCQGRLYYVRYALKLGWSIERLHDLSGIDPWFLDQLDSLVRFEERLLKCAPSNHGSLEIGPEILEVFKQAKAWGYSDAQLRNIWRVDSAALAKLKAPQHLPKFKQVDTCAAEFEAYTPYYYSTHEEPMAQVLRSPAAVAELRAHQRSRGRSALGPAVSSLGAGGASRYMVLDDEHVLAELHDDELRVTQTPKVVVLGGGPNRIGQGIEFDYCCVHAVGAASDMGFETVMINSNPETVSTDYDTSDLLFFEPLTHEDVVHICERLNSRPFRSEPGTPGEDRVKGVFVQFGGQTPLNLAYGLREAGVPILGTSPENVHLAEDREQFSKVLHELGLRQPPSGIAYSAEDAARAAQRLGFPVLVRPSYVLGGRGMQVCNNPDDLLRYMKQALHATDRERSLDAQHPILVDKFLLDAIEVDVDAVSDYGYPGRDPIEGRCDICGIMEHIEEAGIHSGDSSCVLPPHSLSTWLVDELKHQVKLLARRLSVCGLMNVQFAIQDRTVYIIEVNPRASRTIPFVSKATGVPWAKIATQVMLGRSLDESLAEIGMRDVPVLRHTSVKVPVFPFKRFHGTDFVLGPEMRSTGEVMGIDASYPLAFAKGLLAAGIRLPTRGRVLVSVNDADKPRVVPIARELHEMGFEIYSTLRTHETLEAHGVPSTIISKHEHEEHPFLLEMINRRELDLLINTPIHTGSASDEGRWRSASIRVGIPLITTLAGARAVVGAIRALREGALHARALQDYLAPAAAVAVAGKLELGSMAGSHT